MIRVAYWQQNVISCPVTTDPVDGGWSDWGSWDQVLIAADVRREVTVSHSSEYGPSPPRDIFLRISQKEFIFLNIRLPPPAVSPTPLFEFL